MAVEVVMPRLGWTMEEGSLVEWLKHDGDRVQAGEIIFTVESDKAVTEVESFESGVLRIPPDSPSPGTLVPVGGLLAYLVQPGEPAPFDTPARSTAVSAHMEAQHLSTTASQPVAPIPARRNGREQPTISPRARRVATELGVDWTMLKGSGRTGRIVERDVRMAAAQQPVAAVRATPLARRVADDLQVDLEELAASMPGKRIERADVERAAQGVEKPVGTGAPGTRTPISRVRRIIAERMAASAHTTAPVTLTTEADATELVRLRKQLKSDPAARIVPVYTDLLAKLSAQALLEHPMLNARLEGDEIVQPAAVHIGLAVDTDRGLLVPVIRDVQAKTLRQIAEASAALSERARGATLSSEDLQGSTFTITNLGMYDIDAFTPIINLPDCAILGVGRIVPKQVVVDPDAERVAIRHMMFVSLTFDHRLVDGAPAARFLQRIKQLIEQPYLWLVS